MYDRQFGEAYARASLPIACEQTQRAGIPSRLEYLPRNRLQSKGASGHQGRNLSAKTRCGTALDGEFFSNWKVVQSQSDIVSANSRSHGKGSTPRRGDGRQETYTRSELETQIGTTWKTEGSWRENKRNQACKTDDEIVSSAAKTSRRFRIKSRDDKTRTNNNALLKRLKARGNVKTFSGGNVILEEIMYNDSTTNNTNSYSGYEVLNVAQNSPISAAQYSITQYASAVSISGLEMIQNSGKEQIIDLLDGRMNIAEAQLANRIGSDIYLDGSGNGGKNITGLGAAVPDAPTSGTYGGINRATWTFWQSVVYSGVTNGGSAVTAANIQAYMDALVVQLIRGSDKPDLIVADNVYYKLYLQSMQSIQRITDSGNSSQGIGFASLKYYGAGMASDVVLDGGIGSAATANHMWFLNTKYIMFRPHADRNFVPIGGERQAVNQDAIVKLIGWAGNLTTSGSQFQGVLIA